MPIISVVLNSHICPAQGPTEDFDFLRLIGVPHTDLFDGDDPLAFAIHRMEMDFVKPARIDDLLEVRTRYVRAGGARIEADQEIVRLVSCDGAATGDDEVAAAAPPTTPGSAR